MSIVKGGKKMIPIILNGTHLIVESLLFKEATNEDEYYFHDCLITFLNGEVEIYDACDVTLVYPLQNNQGGVQNEEYFA